MNYKYIIVADFETDCAVHEKANPTELAAVAIHPRTLAIDVDNAFSAKIRPHTMPKWDTAEGKLIDTSEDPEYTPYMDKDRKSTIDWHCDLHKCSQAELLTDWDQRQSEKIVWTNFITYLNQYNVKKNPAKKLYYTQPVLSGYNIAGFDLPIFQRINQRYKTEWPFSKMPQTLDLQDIIYYYFNDMPDPDNIKLDTIRSFLGLKSAGKAHEAITDVIDTAKILVRFLQFARKQVNYDKLKDSFERL